MCNNSSLIHFCQFQNGNIYGPHIQKAINAVCQRRLDMFSGMYWINVFKQQCILVYTMHCPKKLYALIDLVKSVWVWIFEIKKAFWLLKRKCYLLLSLFSKWVSVDGRGKPMHIPVNHTIRVAAVVPNDRSKSVWDFYLIHNFRRWLCVVALFLMNCKLVNGLCHRTES